jgi:hypothetical protein
MTVSSRARLVLPVALAVVAASAIAWTVVRRTSAASIGSVHRPAVRVFPVPRVSAPIPINAEVEGKKDWEGEIGKTPNFLDEAGRGIVPYTEARLRWGDDKLYLLLYAGDLDLEGTVTQHDGDLAKDDSFRLEFPGGDRVRVIDVSVLGTVADRLCTTSGPDARCDASWESHAEVAVDKDGTMNKVGDNDEEWVVEMAIPFSSLGISHPTAGTRIPFSVRRCEVGHGRTPCGEWGKDPPSELELAVR